MAAKFLCCLPLQLGVFVVAIFQCIINALAATVFWIVLRIVLTTKIHSGPTASYIIYALTFTFACLMSIIGLIGLIRKNMALIKVLLRIVLYMAVFWLWFSMISFVSLMTSTSASNFDDCIGGETEPSPLLVQTCMAYVHAFRDPKVITMFILLIVVLPIVAQLYGYYIVRAYYKKLRWAESLNDDLEMDSKNQAWTIDGPNIEPPDWKTLSRTTSQVDLTLPTPSSQQVDAELVPLTTSIGSSHASPTPVEAGSEKRLSKGKGKATTMDDVII